MRRIGGLMPFIVDPDNLRLAFWKAKKGKKRLQEITAFASDLDHRLLELREELLNAKVNVGDYHYFKVFDPKERTICAGAFREQVIHHALMNVCHDYFDRVQIFDSYASRPGKGIHAALARAKQFSKPGVWFLKLDVRKFFEQIHHTVLKAQLRNMFKEQPLLDIFDQIIDSYQTIPGRGLPIGNLTSQYFANHYLTGLDHFIKETLHCRYYVRYMDDLVIWHRNKTFLKEKYRIIQQYVKSELHCELKPPVLNAVDRGLPFLGYRIFPHHIRLTQRSKRRYLHKMAFIDYCYENGLLTGAEAQRRALSLIAFTRHADALAFRKMVNPLVS